MTRDRFFKSWSYRIYNSSVESVFYSTTCNSVGSKRNIRTVFTLYKWGFKLSPFSFDVGSLLLNSNNSFGSKKWFYFWINIFQNIHFLSTNGCSSLSFNTAGTFTCVEITDKIFLDYVFGNYCLT